MYELSMNHDLDDIYVTMKVLMHNVAFMMPPFYSGTRVYRPIYKKMYYVKV